MDSLFMEEALSLALEPFFPPHPNPRVGAVVVRDGQIVGRGFHAKTGQPHAEVMALVAAKGQTQGATLYVTLEPCCHAGRTAPCTRFIIECGIARVVYATADPNPLVAGRGAKALIAAGIAITENVLAERARLINRGFFSRFTRRKPFVTAKIGMSLDGRVALKDGTSQWITCEAARADVQHLRARMAAIITGSGTILADDPLFTVRLSEVSDAPQLLRVICSGARPIPRTARIFNTPGEILLVEEKEGVDLPQLLARLAALEINEVLLEAGPSLTSAFLEAGLIDEWVIYVAPRFLGHTGLAPLVFPLDRLESSPYLVWQAVSQVGECLKLVATMKESL